MRILFVNQFYWPDRTGASRLLTDVTRKLASQGHEVTVICGRSTLELDSQSQPAVTVLRASRLSFSRNPILRVASYLCFFTFAAVKSVLLKRQDLVVTLTTPPFTSLLGNLLHATRRTPHIIWEMDMYPEVAVDTGVLRDRSLVTRCLRTLSRWSRRRANRVIALGECMRNRLIRSGLPEAKVVTAENWADGAQIGVVAAAPADRFVVFYSGNLGMAHDMDTIWEAIQRLADHPSIQFRFVGGGIRKTRLEALCRAAGVRNVAFEAFRPSNSLPELFASSRVGLVTQVEGSLGSVVPSKIYEYLAAGRPLLYVGPADSTTGLTIRRFDCGWQVNCGDAQGLSELIQYLDRNPSEVNRAGERGRRAFLEHYDIEAGTSRVADALRLDTEPAAQRSGAVLHQNTTVEYQR